MRRKDLVHALHHQHRTAIVFRPLQRFDHARQHLEKQVELPMRDRDGRPQRLEAGGASPSATTLRSGLDRWPGLRAMPNRHAQSAQRILARGAFARAENGVEPVAPRNLGRPASTSKCKPVLQRNDRRARLSDKDRARGQAGGPVDIAESG